MNALLAFTLLSFGASSGGGFAPRDGSPPAPPPASPPIAASSSSGTYSPLWRDLGEIRDRIDDARDGRLISKRQARGFRREAAVLERAAESYGRDGLSQSEQAELEARALYLRDAISAAPIAATATGSAP